MTLMGPTSRRMAALPQRLLEKVFTPLVVHSQIWLPGGVGAVWVCGAPRFGAGLDVMVAGAAITGPLDAAIAGALAVDVLGLS